MMCLWCETEFEPRASGGKPQRFCSKACRVDFHVAARSWAENAVASGLLLVSALRMARKQRARCAGSRNASIGTQGTPEAETRPGGPLRVVVDNAA